MDAFDTRARAVEGAFAADEARRFRVRIAALRKLALWAETSEPDALVQKALDGADDETLIAHLAQGLSGAGVSAHRVRMRFAACLEEAAREDHG